MNFAHSAHIPEKYVRYPAQRMTLYKRIALIRNQYDADDIADELLDRFGEMPDSVDNLLRIALIRSMAEDMGLRQITEMNGEVRFYQTAPDMEVFRELAFITGGRLRVSMGSGESFGILKLKSGENSLIIVHKMFEKYLENIQNEEKDSE